MKKYSEFLNEARSKEDILKGMKDGMDKRDQEAKEKGDKVLKDIQRDNRWERRKEKARTAVRNTRRAIRGGRQVYGGAKSLASMAKSRGSAGQVSQSQRGGLAVRSTQIN